MRKHPLVLFILAAILFSAGAAAQKPPAPLTGDTAMLQQQIILDSIITPPGTENSQELADVEEPDEEVEDTVAAERDLFLPLIADSGAVTAPFRLRHLPDSQLKAIRHDPAFWYANYPFKPKKSAAVPDRRPGFFGSGLFQVLLWIVIIGLFVAVLVLYLKDQNAGLFRRTRRIGQAEAEAEPENIFAIDYEREIGKADAAGNYRVATRLLFLRMLRRMADRRIIDYKSDRTNLDYLLQLANGPWYTDFFRLTRHFEYSWYGQFQLDQDKYRRIRNDYDLLHAKMGN